MRPKKEEWIKRPWATARTRNLSLLISVPEWQWTWRDWSIVSPSDVTRGKFEVYSAKKNFVQRFDSLVEAQKFCEEFNK